MMTKREIVGTCPLGQIIKEIKVDMFGYYAGHTFIKLVRKDWYYEQLMKDYAEKGLTYSDLRFYAPWPEYKEVKL